MNQAVSHIQLTRVDPYELPLIQPLKIGQEVWHTRKGWVVHLFDSQNAKSYTGEVSPLPAAWGNGTWEACNRFLDYNIGKSYSIEDWLSLLKALPVLQSAFFMALHNSDIPYAFPPKNRQSALLRAGDPLLHESISQKINEGYLTFKLKVQGGSDALRRALDPLLEQLPLGGKIRLDPNQGLSVQELTSWLKFLENLPIEFIEEPLRSDDKALFSIAKDTSIAFGLDEQVQSWENLLTLNNQGWPGVFIVRPPIFGDPLAFLKYDAKARSDLQKKFVYASSFEAFQGVQWLLHFYYQFPNEHAIGLDPLTLFQR